MESFYLFEAGSSKTTLADCSTEGVLKIDLPGVNPNRSVEEFKAALQRVFHPKNDKPVFFYGSGLASHENKAIIISLFDQWNIKSIEVFDDLLGAARALYSDEAGIMAILGTGGISAYYNGRSIVERRGGYGFLIDDLGGGYELGKVIIAAWLNNDLNSDLAHRIQEYFGVKKEEFTSWYYQRKNLKLVSDLVPLIADYKETKETRELLLTYFKRFMHKNILPLVEKHNMKSIKLSGSIGNAFADLITSVLEAEGLACEEIISFPTDRLIAYHRRKP